MTGESVFERSAWSYVLSIETAVLVAGELIRLARQNLGRGIAPDAVEPPD